jgi:hypothetical protein
VRSLPANGAAHLFAARGCDFDIFPLYVISVDTVPCQKNDLDNRSRYFFAVLRDNLVPSDTVGTRAR